MSENVPPGGVPRRARWKRFLVWALLALGLLVALAPYYTGPLLTRVVEGQLEERLDADARVQSVSFRWPARVRVRDVELTDRAGQPLAALDALDARVALLPLLRGAVRAEVDVRYPELHVSREADGAWNWQRVLERAGAEEEPEPDEPDEPGELPDVVARLRVTDGHVVVHGKDGDTTLSDIAFETDVDGLEQRSPFALRLGVRGPNGPAGSVRLEGELTPASGGRIAPEEFAGKLALFLEELDLAAFAPALALAVPADGLGGTLAGSVHLALEPGLVLTGEADVALDDLAVRGPLAEEPARLSSVRLSGNATQQGEGAGTQRFELRADEFLTLAYDGRSQLPAKGAGEIAGTLTLAADLARATELARGWVRFQEGVAVQGRLEHALELTATLRDRAPESASLIARGGVSGLAARDASGRALDLASLQAIALELEASADLVRGTLTVPRLDVRAGPLTLAGDVEAAGISLAEDAAARGVTPRIVRGALQLDADLEALRGTLAQLVDLADVPFGGTLTARGTLDAAAGGGHALEARVEARGLALAGTRVGELRGDLRGQRGADGALGGTGTLSTSGLVLALGEGAPLALPDATAELAVEADARGTGRHTLGVRTLGGELALALQARSEVPSAGELALRTVLTVDGRLGPLAVLAAPLVPLSSGLAGDLHGTGDLHARTGSAGLAAAGGKLQLDFTNLSATDAAGRPLALEALARTTLVLDGELDATTGVAELRSFALRAGGLDVRGSGRARGLAGTATPALDDGRVEVAADLARLGPDLGRVLELGWTIGGSPLTAEARVASQDGRVDASGTLSAAELLLARDGEPPLAQRDIAVEFDVGYDAGEGSLHVRSAKAGSATGSLALKGTLNELADPTLTRGAMELVVECALERVMADLALEPPESGRSTSGPLRGTFALDGDRGAFRITGKAAVEPFRLVLAPTAAPDEPAREPIVIEEPSVALEVDARVVLERLDVELAKLTLTSGLARGGAKGRILNLAGAAGEPVRFERLAGELAYVPERLGAVLAPWLPGKLEGADEERVTFALDGELAQLDLASVLATADARVDLGLGRLVRPEIVLDGAIGLEAQDGRAVLRGDLTANEGTLQLDGTLDLTESPQARSKLMATANALRLNAGLAPLLARVHPLFAGASLAQGTLDGLLGMKLDLAYDAPLTLEQLEAGWEALPKAPINGTGSFDVKELSLRGSPLLASLEKLGLKVPETITARPIQFTVQRGRLVYAEPWTWTLGDTETTFTGSVGLDQTLDLAWNVPITDGLVARNEFLRYFAGETLSIPLRGTVKAPRLDVDDMLKDLAKEAAKRELEGRLGLGGGGRDDPGQLLNRADELWDKGQKADASKLYARLRDEFKLSLTYALNKDRIRERSRFKEEPK